MNLPPSSSSRWCTKERCRGTPIPPASSKGRRRLQLFCFKETLPLALTKACFISRSGALSAWNNSHVRTDQHRYIETTLKSPLSELSPGFTHVLPIRQVSCASNGGVLCSESSPVALGTYQHKCWPLLLLWADSHFFQRFIIFVLNYVS